MNNTNEFLSNLHIKHQPLKYFIGESTMENLYLPRTVPLADTYFYQNPKSSWRFDFNDDSLVNNGLPFLIATTSSNNKRRNSSNKKIEMESSVKKSRRNRTAFTDYQLNELEQCFLEYEYPNVSVRERLAARLNLPELKIQVWMKNRRAKHRKHERNKPIVNDNSSHSKISDRSQAAVTKENAAITWNPALAMASGFYPMFTNNFS